MMKPLTLLLIISFLIIALGGWIHGAGSGGSGCISGQFDFSCNVAITAAVMP